MKITILYYSLKIAINNNIIILLTGNQHELCLLDINTDDKIRFIHFIV